MSSAIEKTRQIEPLPLAGAEQKALREVWGNTLVELAADYPDLVVLDGDLANSTRADIFAAACPDRFFEMGIAEQNMVGVAAGMATLGALWSGSAAGQAFAQAATSTYESSWLPWAGALVAVGCGVGLLLGWWMARWILLFWMAYGAVESLALLDEPHVNLPVLGAYAAIAVLLFLPPSNEWLSKA